MSTTSLNKHIQKNGNGELARAKAALKGRLKQKMMQEALDELQDTDQVVKEAMDAFTMKEETLKEAKDVFKTRLIERIRQQALGEIVAEVNGANLDEHAGEGLLLEAKEAFKERLLNHVLQIAIGEVGAEMGIGEENLDAHGEQLAEAKDAFKARLRDHVYQQAVEETNAEASETQEALDPHDDHLTEAREALKARLREQIYQQAVDEVGADTESISEDLFARADTRALDGVKETLKQQLLDQVYQQALAEIDAEVEVTEDELDDAAAVSRPEEPTSDAAEEPETPDALADDDALFAHDEEAHAEEGSETIKLIDDDAILDVEFWDDDKADDEEKVSEEAVELPLPEDAFTEEHDPGFFLNDPTEPGNESEAASADDWAEAPVDDLLDFTGDGAWDNSVPYTDAITDSDAALEPSDEPAATSGDASDTEDTQDEAPLEEEGIAYYVYGLLSSESTAEDALPMDGIDPEFSIYPVVHDKNVALVSKVKAEEYGPEALAVNLLDPVWKERQAETHEAITTRLSQDGLFLPVPLCTVYESEEAVKALFSIDDYVDAMKKIKGCTQFRVRLYRNVDVLHQQVVENSTAVQQLMADIKSKPKGGSQSIKKKMVATIHEEEATMTDNCTKDVHERLFGHASDVELGALDGAGEREKTELILDATYLVHEDNHGPFALDIDALINEYALHGFEFDVTGPEPPTMFSHLNPFSNA